MCTATATATATAAGKRTSTSGGDSSASVAKRQRRHSRHAAIEEDSVPDSTATTPTPSHPDVNQAPPVFFMIGSQRSGSNWLETMINLSPDVSGPQPPHILKNWAPLVGNYGDLSVSGNFLALQDHVCAFVEAAPLPLVDPAGVPLVFERGAFAARVAKCVGRSASGRNSLVAILEAVFEAEAEAHGKATWICKSLTNVVHHQQLLDHFGEQRLRYIYLRRDPRDVCLSFKKCKSVGDDHYFVIAQKWARLQEEALAVEKLNGDLFFSVSYEQLLNNRDFTMWQFFEFSGLAEPVGGYDGAKTSPRCERAAKGSERWGNLTRGRSFVAEQKCKYLKALDQGEMDAADVAMIEAVVAEQMRPLGYKTTTAFPAAFSGAEVAVFKRLNAEGVQAQRKALEQANPAEAAQIKAQANTLLAASTIIPLSC